MIAEDLEKAGILPIPRNLAAILAKLHTGEGDGGKGVFMIGPTGTGKTKRMRWASDAFEIRMETASRLVDLLMDCGTLPDREEVLNCVPCRWSEIPAHYNDLIIDDLGTEPDGQNIYGTKRTLMQDAICRRYELFPRWKTHFTSNLTKEEIRSRYGERVWSRLQEMCVFITLAGRDRRIDG